jgi:serine phosphatase RsbU (regulator of sigma subunit)
MSPTLENIELLLQSSSELMEDNLPEAILKARDAEKIATEIFDTKALADCSKQIALCYSQASNYIETLKAVLQAQELYQSINDYKGEADCLNILGGVYNFLKDYQKRLECNLRCLELRKKVNDKNGQLSTYNNIGDTYTVMGDYDNALRYFNICLSFPDITTRIKAIVHHNIGEVNFFKKDYTNALIYLNQGLELGKESNYWQIIIASSTMIGAIHNIQNNTTKAIEILNAALKVAQEKKSIEEEIPIYKELSITYAKINNFNKAYEFLNLHNQYKEQLLADNNAQQLKKIEFNFQLKAITSETEETKRKNTQLTKAFNKIEQQRNEIEYKNIAITDSIHYAKRIQLAIIPSENKVKSLLNNSFVFYQPKDIVSGDFYWTEKIGAKTFFAVIDCTGHGVPGAFVSLIAFNLLNKVVLEKQISQPSEILTQLDELLIRLFKKSDKNIRDGFDMGLCCWDNEDNTLNFSGANHSLFRIINNELQEIKGTKASIGYSLYETKHVFKNHAFRLTNGESVYLCSDGLPDQFGGEKGKKLKWKGFKSWLTEIQSTPMNKQKNKIHQLFKNWKKDQEQIDDVCMLGVKFNY